MISRFSQTSTTSHLWGLFDGSSPPYTIRRLNARATNFQSWIKVAITSTTKQMTIVTSPGDKKSLSVAYLRPAGTELSDLTAALKHRRAHWLSLPKPMISIDLIWDQGRLDAKDKRSWEDWKNDTAWICAFVTKNLSLPVSVCQSFGSKQTRHVSDRSVWIQVTPKVEKSPSPG